MKGKFGLSRKPPGCYEFQGRLLIADIPHHAPDETVMLTKELEGLQHPLIDQAEIRTAWVIWISDISLISL